VTIPHARRAEAGFTLVEMAVATLVMMLALMMAAQILDESGRVLAHSAARERDTWTPLTEEWLRRDLRVGTGATTRLGVTPFGVPYVVNQPMVISQSFGSVTWGRVGSYLVRKEPGQPSKRLLDHVELWEWRVIALNPMVVEAQVRFRRASSFLHDEEGGVPQPDLGKPVTLHWVVLLRAGALGRQW